MTPDANNAAQPVAPRIHAAALALVEEHGLQGFTMQDLAERVGVSRRTLFNHVAGKIDAVLGPQVEPSPEAWQTFRAGGPTGVLLADLGAVATRVLTDSEENRDRVLQLRRVLASDPHLLGLAHERFREQLGALVPEIGRRDDADEQTAGLALRLVVTLVDLALDRAVGDADGAGVADHFCHVLQQSQHLFDAARTPALP